MLYVLFVLQKNLQCVLENSYASKFYLVFQLVIRCALLVVCYYVFSDHFCIMGIRFFYSADPGYSSRMASEAQSVLMTIHILQERE